MKRSEILRQKLAAKLAERKAKADALEALRTQAAEDNSTVTAEQIREAQAARDAFDATIDALVDERTAALAEEARDDALNTLQSEVTPTNPGQRAPAPGTAVLPGDERNVSLGAEPRTYTAERNLNESVSFFQDAWRAQQGDVAARERVDRHRNEVRVEAERTGKTDRATTTGSFAGLVVPQYLTDMVAPVLRFGRPLANASNRHDLPAKGMQIIIPRGTTGASTAVQSAENTALSNTDEVLANLTVPVVTIGGQQDVSRQSLERGEMIDSFVYADLAKAYAANVDNQIINGSGSAGQMLGILNTAGISAATAFGAAATAQNFNLKVAGQVTAVGSAGAGLWAKCLVMHPRRWGWLLGQVDSTGRPIVTANTIANFNALATVSQPGQISTDPDPITGFQYVGMHSSGLPVLTDLNIPTNVGTNNEDVVLASDTLEYHLWEEGDGTPKELRFEQTNGGALTTKLVVYGYAAFTAGRYPQATGKVGGLDTTASNGLFLPAF